MLFGIENFDGNAWLKSDITDMLVENDPIHRERDVNLKKKKKRQAMNEENKNNIPKETCTRC